MGEAVFPRTRRRGRAFVPTRDGCARGAEADGRCGVRRGELFLVECTRRGRVTVAAMDRGTRAGRFRDDTRNFIRGVDAHRWGAAALGDEGGVAAFDERTSDDATGRCVLCRGRPPPPASFACLSHRRRGGGMGGGRRGGADAVW